MKDAVKINTLDNVAVALRCLEAGSTIEIDNDKIKLQEDIPAGHKFALVTIQSDDIVIKYGMPIGRAVKDIEVGCWVHTHNIVTQLDEKVIYSYDSYDNVKSDHIDDDYFMGYMRNDGSAGIRNEIWIIPTVGCVNDIAKALAGRMNNTHSEISVNAFTHPYGCSQMSEDQENTRKALTGLIKHPNAGGVLVLGLGCENSGIEVLKKYLGKYDYDRIRFLECQAVDDEIAEGEKILSELIEYASTFNREKINMNKLIIGLKCGGSDGFSGITANPLVGRFADKLLNKGGSVILTEVPEMFGAESLLMNRCISPEIFKKTVSLINNFKDYYINNGQTVYENPSPGNKKGGISTLEDKALGCTQKAGSSPVMDVLSYGETVDNKGLNLLSAPGNDLVASTALAVSGAQLILFTTGRGTPFASPVPTVKIATNSTLAKKKTGWIDFNAGVVIEESNFDTEENRLYEYVKKVASGKQVKSELNGYHDIALFKNGVTL